MPLVLFSYIPCEEIPHSAVCGRGLVIPFQELCHHECYALAHENGRLYYLGLKT